MNLHLALILFCHKADQVVCSAKVGADCNDDKLVIAVLICLVKVALDLFRGGHCRLGKMILGIFKLLKLVVKVHRIQIKTLKILLALEKDMDSDYINSVLLVPFRCILDASC